MFFSFSGCKKEDNPSISSLQDVKIKVSFDSSKSSPAFKVEPILTKETPQNYFIALKSVTVMGKNGTADILLFDKADLSSSFVFDFMDNNTVHSLLKGTTIPEGEYSTIKIEVYYLQMNIAIATASRGVERRNIRIYLSDDTENEQGLHQPGDMTQINNGQEIGWLLGENQIPNMDPVTPRDAAYTYSGDGTSWYNFNEKSGEDFGPFGDVDFWTTAPQPIYSTLVNFNYIDKNGSSLVLDFNVKDCWQFEDKDSNGSFGAGDIDPEDPTLWHMQLPGVTVTQE